MHIAGIVFALMGLGFLYFTFRTRGKAAAAAAACADQERSPSLVALNEIMPSIVNIALMAAGAFVVFLYFAMGVSGRISLVDLGGFLFLLACYGLSVTLQARARRPKAS